MIVWVVERGSNETRFIDGVYTSMGAVRSAYPGETWQPTPYAKINETPIYQNKLDWDDSLKAYPHELQGFTDLGLKNEDRD